MTITGTNLGFLNTTTVDFGTGNPGIVTSDNGTTVVAVSPTGTGGPVDVTVTTPGGTSNPVAADQFTYLAPDLVVNNITAQANAVTDQGVVVNWTDQNNGTEPAAGTWVDNVYAATDAQGDNPSLLGSFSYIGSLAVGASVQLAQSVSLPGTAGTYWFVVTTDATGSVPEGIYSSNDTTVAAAPIDVASAPLPDLVVTGITPPPNGVLSGTSVPITFVVMNQGTAPTSVSVWQDWVILSQDPTLGSTYNGVNDQALNNQPIIEGFDNPAYLGVDQNYSQTVNVTLPISAQGTWYVYVVPDGTGNHHPYAMPELSRTDKLQISAGFTVDLSPAPALDVTAVQVPLQVFSGTTVNVAWTVTNTGSGPTAPDFGSGATAQTVWGDAVYLSQSPTLNAQATLLGEFPHYGSLAADASYYGSANVTIPIGLSGPYYFFVETDAAQQIFQNGDTLNNVGVTATPITVELTPPPELEVSAITAPTTALASQPLTFSYQITNIGAGAIQPYGQQWSDAYYLSPTSTFDPSTAIALAPQFLNGSQDHGELDAGGVLPITMTAVLPNDISGVYYLIVVADAGDQVFQLDRSHDIGSSPSTVQVSSEPADLEVSALSASPTGQAGGAIQVNWTVTNEGTGDTANGAVTGGIAPGVVDSWQDNVYADTSFTLTANAVLLGSFTHTFGLSTAGDLNAGASYSESQLVPLPISLAGYYNLFVVSDEIANNGNLAPRRIHRFMKAITQAAFPLPCPSRSIKVSLTSPSPRSMPRPLLRQVPASTSTGRCKTSAQGRRTSITGMTTSGCPSTRNWASPTTTSTWARCSTATF